MKQLKTFLAALLLLCCSVANAQTFEADGIYYTVTDATNKTVGVTSGSNEYAGEVVIPSKVTYSGTEYSVTSIESSAFVGSMELTSLVIPSSVNTIGAYVFNNCISLTSIEIPNSVTSIGNEAFAYSGLTSIAIPNSVTSIGKSVFTYCSSLTSVTMGNGVTTIGNGAFYNCI